MKSYIKLYGPAVMKGLRALEKVAVGMPECSFWHVAIPDNLPYLGHEYVFAHPEAEQYYSNLQLAFSAGSSVEIPRERLHKMISKSGHTLGDYDFFFEWHADPTWQQIEELIEKIDEALKDTGCTYTITTK